MSITVYNEFSSTILEWKQKPKEKIFMWKPRLRFYPTFMEMKQIILRVLDSD
jgi:hypothetical protein